MKSVEEADADERNVRKIHLIQLNSDFHFFLSAAFKLLHTN